jgi:phosphate transport system substrate-binding protein
MKTKLSLTEAAVRNRALAGAILLGMGVVSNAHAQSATLYGGGATLPAVGYLGKNAANGGTADTRNSSASGNVGTQDDTTALFGAYDASSTSLPDVQYCQTGSGVGKATLEGVDNASNTCPLFTTSATGFGAPGNGPTYPNFGAADAPFAQSDVNNFSWSASHTALVQIPTIGGAIAIVYNPTNTGFATTNTSNLALTDSQICQIFSGQITNWNQITGNGTLNNQAITVVYRSDGSGTSFNFSNHLAAVCAAYLPSGDYFSTGQTFSADAATAGYNVGTGTTIGASGNPNVINQVEGTAGAIGYAELANALAQSPALNYATVNGVSPTSLASPLSVTYVTGDAITGYNTTTAPYGNPTLGSVSGDGESQCLLLVDPNSYANPSSGYPILAVSYLLGYYSGNGANTANLVKLLSGPYTTRFKNASTNVGTGTGLVWLSNSGLTSSMVSSCITN